MARLRTGRAEDEELVTLVEHDACGVDAVQVLTGCTFGKGNFFFRDYGKHVYTVARRSDGKAGISAKPKRRGEGEPASKDERSRRMLVAPLDELFDIQEVPLELPERASIHDSVQCDTCGEPTMATRVRDAGGKRLCVPCSETGLK